MAKLMIKVLFFCATHLILFESYASLREVYEFSICDLASACFVQFCLGYWLRKACFSISHVSASCTPRIESSISVLYEKLRHTTFVTTVKKIKDTKIKD